MKLFVLAMAILMVFTASLCLANPGSLQEAYALFNRGEREKAVEMTEDYVRDNPDPAAYYFLGYAYYEMKQMERSNNYFSEAFKLRDFYSPISESGNSGIK